MTHSSVVDSVSVVVASVDDVVVRVSLVVVVTVEGVVVPLPGGVVVPMVDVFSVVVVPSVVDSDVET